MISSSLRHESPLFVKTRDFAVWLLQHTSKFPRQYRHSLTERVENAALELLEALGEAAIVKTDGSLEKADLRLWQVRQHLRIAQDLGLFPARVMEHAAGRMDELGRLIGGWKRKAGGITAAAAGASGRLVQQ